MHEFYIPTTGKGRRHRRDRRKCEFYNSETEMCMKLFESCVGPAICDKYSEVDCSRRTLVGINVQNKYYGIGVVISDDGETCTVQYKSTKIQCKKEVVLKLINS